MSYEIEKDWITQAGLRAVVTVSKSGERKTHRCGYVAITPDHKLYKVGYSEQVDCISSEDANTATIGKKSPILAFTASCRADTQDSVRRSPDIIFDVHGGLTYSGGNENYPVESKDSWWFGFDCAHAGDGQIEPTERDKLFYDGPARDLCYVEAECESLAKQLGDFK